MAGLVAQVDPNKTLMTSDIDAGNQEQTTPEENIPKAQPLVSVGSAQPEPAQQKMGITDTGITTGDAGQQTNLPQAPTAPPQFEGAQPYQPGQERSMKDITKELMGGVEDIVGSKSPLMQRAERQGQRLAQRRGLGDSSFAARAAQSAVYDAALPLAQQSLDTVSRERMQLEQQRFQAGENAMARDLERELTVRREELEKLMQERDQAFKRGENELGRELERELSEKQIEHERLQQERDQKFREEEQGRDIGFKERENQLARELEDLMQRRDQAFKQGENELGRELERELQEKQREQEQLLQERDIGFKERESQLARDLEKLMQERDQAFKRGENELGRELEREISDKQIEHERLKQERDQKFQEEMKQKDFDYDKWKTEATQGFEKLLETSKYASGLMDSYNTQVATIMNNPDTSSTQKRAALKSLQDSLKSSLSMLQGMMGTDLGKYLPGLNLPKNPDLQPPPGEGGEQPTPPTTPPSYGGGPGFGWEPYPGWNKGQEQEFVPIGGGGGNQKQVER